MEEARDAFFPALQFLLYLHDAQSDADFMGFDDVFNEQFRLGPNGLHPVIDTLMQICHLTLDQRSSISDDEYALQLHSISTYAASLHSLLLYFRTTVARDHYDPPPFAELQRELHMSRNRFGVCNQYSESEPFALTYCA